MSEVRRFRGPFIAILVVLAVGVAGYQIIEGWGFLDALFMTVTTVMTVGYGEIHPLSSVGRIFTIAIIFGGVGVVLYTTTTLFGWLLETDWGERQRKRQMELNRSRLRDHFVICGFGRVGRSVAQVLRDQKVPFVVVDVDESTLATAEADGFLTVTGDAASDEVLFQAGIDRARGLISAVDSDAANVYVVLSARGLRPDLLIVARASSKEAGKKLERAGATHVLSPYHLAGQQMAMLAVKPMAVEFVDTLLHGGRDELVVEEVAVVAGSPLAGITLAEVKRRCSEGVVIVALRQNGLLVTAAADDYVLRPDDRLVAVGRPIQLKELEKLV